MWQRKEVQALPFEPPLIRHDFKEMMSVINEAAMAVTELIRAAKDAADNSFSLGMAYMSPLSDEAAKQSAIRQNAELQVRVDIAIRMVEKMKIIELPTPARKARRL